MQTCESSAHKQQLQLWEGQAPLQSLKVKKKGGRGGPGLRDVKKIEASLE